MSEKTTISVRVDDGISFVLTEICERIGINKSDFLRACIIKLCDSSDANKELFISSIGFTKSEKWSPPK